jgi:hypothetical protein
MDAAGYSETLAGMYQVRQRHIPGDRYLIIQCDKNIRSNMEAGEEKRISLRDASFNETVPYLTRLWYLIKRA